MSVHDMYGEGERLGRIQPLSSWEVPLTGSSFCTLWRVSTKGSSPLAKADFNLVPQSMLWPRSKKT